MAVPSAHRAGTPVRGGIAPRVKLGVTKLLAEPEKYLGKARARVGLVANYNAVDENATPIVRLFGACPSVKLSRIFTAEHGLWGCEQAGVRLGHTVDAHTGVEAISLYGETQRPTPEMLHDIDVLICDGNDIGARYWTGLATAALCIEAAAEAGKPIIVTDRPNPLGGKMVEGGLLDLAYRSFVGYDRIPIRHGMTPGELAAMFAGEARLDVDLRVIPMEDWRRDMLFPETGHFWTGTPNMPTFETALVYPGTCLFEGTTLSEGRGTAKPFRLIGAPWLDAIGLADRLNAMDIGGARFRPARFRPMFSKHGGVECAGVEVYVTEARALQPVRLGLSMLQAVREQNPEAFGWHGAGDQGDKAGAAGGRRLFIDLLAGGTDLRTWIEDGATPDAILGRWEPGIARFMKRRERYLMYG
ncbi:MAG: exo-beta-N-acetylmuramidase NamZ domain-containing protein [Bacteroidota bacterium]